MELRGKTVLITGASSGIGEALAVLLAKEGCRLLLVARRGEALQALADRIRPDAADVDVFVADVRDAERCAAATARMVEKWGRVDIAILSAGVGTFQRVNEFDASTANDIIGVNVTGVINGVAAVLPTMIRQRTGMIVGISSIAAHIVAPYSAAYSASKAAVSTLLRGLQLGLKRHGVKILIVEPGFVRTPMTAGNKRMPFLMEVDEAARRIVRALRREKGLIRFPWLMYAIVKCMSVWRDGLARRWT